MQTIVPEPPTFFFSFGVFFIIIPVVIFLIIVVWMFRRFSRFRGMATEDVFGMVRQMQEIMTEMPAFAIPEEHRSTSGESEVRTVRLPTQCPSCQAPVSHETIDWVGPLTAKCSYCGSTLRANLERL